MKRVERVAMGVCFVLAAACAGLAACYATTGSTPSCAADPAQAWCFPPIHDDRADAGR